jgi:hypothetical protein
VVNNIIVILILSLLSFLTIISLTNYIFAQYIGGGGTTGASSLEEQLKKAQRMLQEAGSETEKYYESKQFPLSSYITIIPSKFNDTQTYENKDLGFTIKYPSNERWNLIYFKNDKNSTDNNTTLFGEDSLHLSKPVGYNNDTNVIIEIMPRNNTFFAFTNPTLTEKDIALSIMLKHFNYGGKILDHGKLNLTNNSRGYYIDIIDTFNQRMLGYYIQYDEKIFYIEYSSENPIAFEVYLPDARGIMELIQFIN